MATIIPLLKEIKKRSYIGTPQYRIDFWKQPAKKFNAGIEELEQAQEVLDQTGNISSESFIFYMERAIKEIRLAELEAALMPLAEYGYKFKKSKRGPDKITALLDHELKVILSELGINAAWKDVVREIEKKALDYHPFFQELDWEAETIFMVDPADPRHEAQRTLKAVQNRLSSVKKVLNSKK